MNKEMLDILNDLSKKPTTELALQIMELSSENLILEQQVKKQKEEIERQKYLLREQGAELKKLYSEIGKLQERIKKAIEYLEAPNRDNFDYSKAKLLDILNEVLE